MLYGYSWPKTDPDIRIILARQQKPGKKAKAATASSTTTNGTAAPPALFSAYRRQGRSGKGSWVEGGGDEEERVMDHRTIHRFVGPEDERELTRKGLLIAAEEAKKMGEEEWTGLRNLDGQGRRRGTSSDEVGSVGEGTEDSRGSPFGYGGGSGANGIGVLGEWMREEGVDGEGRRRSGRIVESRVYVSVDMKR